jgi:hypothetical protein
MHHYVVDYPAPPDSAYVYSTLWTLESQGIQLYGAWEPEMYPPAVASCTGISADRSVSLAEATVPTFMSRPSPHHFPLPSRLLATQWGHPSPNEVDFCGWERGANGRGAVRQAQLMMPTFQLHRTDVAVTLSHLPKFFFPSRDPFYAKDMTKDQTKGSAARVGFKSALCNKGLAFQCTCFLRNEEHVKISGMWA